MARIRWRALLRPIALIAVALVASTLAVAAFERLAGIPNASAGYLVAVVVVAVGAGTAAAVVTALGAFLLYDVLFVEPLHALTVADPAELLTLLLLLFVGVVAGRLAGSQRERAAAALRREREVRALLAIQRSLASGSAEGAMAEIARVLVAETHFERVAIAVGEGAAERTVTDTDAGRAFPDTAVTAVLQARTGVSSPDWVLVHSGQRTRRIPRARVPHRVAIEANLARLGTIRALRDPDAGPVTAEETRLLASAADQMAQAMDRDRLAAEATTAEVARRSDELKSALLASVSHELRTPLAAIRATAGTLADPEVEWPPGEVRGAGAVIDREAERLARLVGNLLDLGRIEGGALRPAAAPFVLADLVADAIGRAAAVVGDRSIDVLVPPDLPAVLVDAVYVDLVIANVLENAARYAGPDVPIRITAATVPGREWVRLTIEDGGQGVPYTALSSLFDKFYRVPRTNETARRGTGIGLTIVRGLVEAMGGSVAARRSELGGLALDLELPVAAPMAGAADSPLDATA
jgi:two-component system, OmpR family, sensor histidine kinase KdpD